MTIQVAKSILLIVSALFPIVDPIGGSPVFLLLTRDYPAETRRVLARRIIWEQACWRFWRRRLVALSWRQPSIPVTPSQIGLRAPWGPAE
jgi:hypothetical protein